MADEDDDNTETEETEDEESEEAPGSKESLSHTEVNRLLAKEKRAARKRFEDELGMAPSEAKKLLAALKEKQESEMSDAERISADAKAKLAEAEQRETYAAQALLRSDIESRLRRADGDRPGLREDRLERATKLVLSDVLESDDDDTDASIATAVADLFGDSPEWFGSAAGDRSKGGVGPTPGRKGGENKPAGGNQDGKGKDAKAILERYKTRSRGQMAPYRPGKQDV